MKTIKRTALTTVKSLSEQFPALLVDGARQVGKTTLLQDAAEPSRRFVSFDDPDIRALARRDPALFLQAYPPPVIIDEMQYAPQILPLIKMAIDKNPNVCGQFWLTGSQKFHLMHNVGESLAGRIAIIDLAGISQGEELGRCGDDIFSVPDALPESNTFDGMGVIYRRIHRGGYPALVSGRVKDWESFYKSYVRTYIERDVHDLVRVTDEERFLMFLKAAAARTGQLLNLSELARDVGIGTSTARDWMGVLGRPASTLSTTSPRSFFTSSGAASKGPEISARAISTSSEWRVVSVSVEKAQPSIGRSFRNGSPETLRITLVRLMPPITKSLPE